MHKIQLLVALWFLVSFLTDNFKTLKQTNYACPAPENMKKQTDENPRPEVRPPFICKDKILLPYSEEGPL